jgi:hypothetical protein
MRFGGNSVVSSQRFGNSSSFQNSAPNS